MQIKIPYKPREAFIPYHESNKRFGVTVAHRRAGKTVARINKLIKKAVQCTKMNPRFGYLAPYFIQAKDIAWLYLKHYAKNLMEICEGGKINESELSITLPHNGAVIRLYGAENAERMRGLYFDGIVVDEAQGMPRHILTTIIMPALSDRQGWLDCSGTPRGWENLLGELVKQARSDDKDWFLQILPASKTNIIPQEELRRLRAIMSENEYAQEMECSFDAAITGSVYGKQMEQAETDGRITNFEYHDALPVSTAWDLGFDDATAIWFFQIAPGEIWLVDYYENNGHDIGHYLDVIKKKPYRYQHHYVPHDAGHKTMAAGGRSIIDQAYEQGVKMEMISATTQQNSIEAARKTLPRCWFDRVNCGQGIDALKNYHFKFDQDKKVFSHTPFHNWASHGSDAFELLSQAWQAKVTTNVDLDRKQIENTFYNNRRLHKLDLADPYRNAYGAMKAKRK